MSRKRLINTTEGYVDDNLQGLVTVNPGLKLLKGYPRVVVRSDLERVIKRGHVTILTGGGAGHEPGHSGYVGPGMASAVVTGPIFTSPPTQDVLAAIRAVGRGNNAGVLVTFNNYTGDRLTFGLAMERAKAEGIKLEVFINADDCALESVDKTAGRRGLVGGILAIKIAGAMADQGKSLEEITQLLEQVAANMGTIGLCLSPCSVPGSGPFFHLAQDEMTLGLGLHGEPGVKTLKVMPAKETVGLMLDHMTNATNDIHFPLKAGEHVVCLLNNLGSLTFTEMNIVAMDVSRYLERRGVVISRFYSGHYVTSQEMVGISITLLRLTDNLQSYLDYPTTAPGWKSQCLPPADFPPNSDPHLDLDVTVPSRDQNTCGLAMHVSKASQRLIYTALKTCCERLIESEAMLNLLDTECGDGDCGQTFKCGAKAILARLGEECNPGLPVDCPCYLGNCLAELVNEKMGGSTGGLYGIFLTAASVALETSVAPEAWYRALKDGTDAIIKYGGASRGYRTMLDALCPAVDAVEETIDRDTLQRVVLAAKKGADSTAGMKAMAGRASYVEASRLQAADPGAIAVSIWLSAIKDTINNA